MTKKMSIPVSDDAIRDLSVGNSVLLSGIMITGRDAVHKWLADTFIERTRSPRETTWPCTRPSNPSSRAE